MKDEVSFVRSTIARIDIYSALRAAQLPESILFCIIASSP